MNHSKIMAAALAVGLASSLTAQTVQTVPAGFTTAAPTSSTSYPWNTTTLRVQMCYDSSHIKSAGPVIISRLRFRSFLLQPHGRAAPTSVPLSSCRLPR